MGRARHCIDRADVGAHGRVRTYVGGRPGASTEIDIDVARHGFDRRHPIARPLGLDLFLARDERNLVGADAGSDLVVDLARQETQRQADHAALVAEHALDCEMRLAGVGWPEHRRDVADARFQVAGHSRALQ
jgi:hypothetical protein